VPVLKHFHPLKFPFLGIIQQFNPTIHTQETLSTAVGIILNDLKSLGVNNFRLSEMKNVCIRYGEILAGLHARGGLGREDRLYGWNKYVFIFSYLPFTLIGFL
jgi:hypothetical protein